MQTDKVVLFGLLLSLLVLNGVECQCYFSEELKAGQTYYAYNPYYPKDYQGEYHCIWEARSPDVVKINCSIEMPYCNQDKLSIQFTDKMYSDCGYKTTDIVRGKNPIIRLDTQYNSTGRFLCQIETESNCKCGWKKVTRIVGGEETGVNEYPMMSGMVDALEEMIYCGSSIISDRYVLTAAHCVENRNIKNIGVIVGEHDVTTGKDTKRTKLYRLIECKIHPWYFQSKKAYDVAVCKTVERIVYSAEVGPVCLPFHHKQDSFDGDSVTALGWGLTEFAGSKATTLQKVALDVINLNKCKKFYKDVDDKYICTYTPGKDTCQMDSGGPLLWQNPTTHNLVLAGIISSGIGCASDEPAIATRTGAVMDWILDVTRDAQYCKVE